MITIGYSDTMGREVIAADNIACDAIIECCELLILSYEDTIKINNTELKYYTFVYEDGRDCLVLGNGEIFNHSDSPNVSYQIEMIDGRKKMIFKALRYITTGEQLFIDYKADSNDTNVKLYQNKNLI